MFDEYSLLIKLLLDIHFYKIFIFCIISQEFNKHGELH